MESTFCSSPLTSGSVASSSIRCRPFHISSAICLSPRSFDFLKRRRLLHRIRAHSSSQNHNSDSAPLIWPTFGQHSFVNPVERKSCTDHHPSPLLDGCSQKNSKITSNFMQKSLALALFCITVSFFPYHGVQMPACSAPLVDVIPKRQVKKKKNSNFGDHEFSRYTRRLLEKVSILLQRIDEVKSDKANMNDVKEALKEVKLCQRSLQEEVLRALNTETGEMRREKSELIRRSESAIDTFWKAKKEKDKLVGRDGGDKMKENIEELETIMTEAEEEYNELWDKVSEIDDKILKRETLALSVGVRELASIERESELLVERFSRQWKQRSLESILKDAPSNLLKSEIEKELETARKQYWEQVILPNILQVEDSDNVMDKSTKQFVLNIKQRFKESRELQKNLESSIRSKLRSFGDEKRFIVNTPADETLKGFPEVELKWMFGNKEVVVPKAVSLRLYHGWRKWREEAKSRLKKSLLENVDHGKKYLAERQECILLDRDRIVSKTWYNDEKNRWEMDPISVPYAVSRKLVEYARIRHDWAVMYLGLKGDDREYYVDIQEFDLLFEDFGGFDGLYLKMLASCIPTAVQLMWIPLSELDIRQQFLFVMRLTYRSLAGLWNSMIVSYVRERAFKRIKNTTDDIMMMIVFPVVEFLIPKAVRMKLGMAWPEEVYQTVGSTWYLQWQSEAEMSFKARKVGNWQWYFWFLIRSGIFFFVLFNVFRFMRRKIPRLLGYGRFRRDPNLRKLRRVKYYFKYRLNRIIRRKKEGVDPIRSAFDQMKRVKNPPIRLKDFASVDSMREEINEVVAFLQNPGAFKEMGARAPRGVLIVGERGTGKTSLALAIAAEAKVPVVEVKAQQLEAGLWVGQSASNVRELFQTARDLAPVILFVEDFDLFAGVRGKFIHTKKQDHEAFINQLLVELDGFEKQDGVVLIATTRNLKQIDQALRRPGRMDRVLHLQRPTQLEREKILHIAANETMDEELIDYVDWKKVAEKTALLRPIELKLVPMSLEGTAFRNKFLDADELLSYCSWLVTLNDMIPGMLRETKLAKRIGKWQVNHLGLTLTREDLESVVDLMEPYGQISNGIELLTPPLDWTRETKYPHAVWAAGRGLIALLLPNFDEVDNIWLEPASWEGIGCTKITKAKNEGSIYGNVESRSYLEKKLVFCFGSYIAAELLLPFGEKNFLSSSELKQAQEIATRMVMQYGWGPDDSLAIYFCSNATAALSMGNNKEYEMAAKVEKMYNLAYDKAKELLQKNRRVLEAIVEELLQLENLTGKDLLKILEDNGGIRDQEPFFLSKHNVEVSSSSSINSQYLLGQLN
ncbi:probable inactive ATP-dependent zinc metalloprotease FTSHI 5, chloroplastic isoform X2 [Aristolochia californica]|uniref:probable inactive ATP-dependent zinc metalloprotease FTSHI 5, chloroplastic isoform X2 n=1 Tax=Aristolochia californica TaxID=171875 RepID=UPI0035DF2416